jgi:hypothetical protein
LEYDKQAAAVLKAEHELLVAKELASERKEERKERYAKLKAVRFIRMISRKMSMCTWYLFSQSQEQRIDKLPISRFKVENVVVCYKKLDPDIYVSGQDYTYYHDSQNRSVFHVVARDGIIIQMNDIETALYVEPFNSAMQCTRPQDGVKHPETIQYMNKHMPGYAYMRAFIVRML